jgi:hypothetical protein
VTTVSVDFEVFAGQAGGDEGAQFLSGHSVQ